MKTKIVIASILKPVDDVRSYWKIGQSLAKTNKYEINIIGNNSLFASPIKNIRFHQHSINRSQVLKRLFFPYFMVIKMLHLKPEILIITTHELLIPSVILKVFTGCKIIYDIQENYYNNFKYLKRFPFTQIGVFIRYKEIICHKLLHGFFLAEKIYEYEIPFIDNYIILPNKAIEIDNKMYKKNKSQFIFSGTISHYSEVLLAVKSFKQLAKHIEDASLLIIGQVHDSKLESTLREIAKQEGAIQLEISNNAIPYIQIYKAIKESCVGLVSYQPNEVNKGKMPTKLYEYIHHGLMVLSQVGSHWNIPFLSSKQIIDIDYNQIINEFTIEKVIDHLNHPSFTNRLATSWDTEEKLLLNYINTLNNKS